MRCVYTTVAVDHKILIHTIRRYTCFRCILYVKQSRFIRLGLAFTYTLHTGFRTLFFRRKTRTKVDFFKQPDAYCVRMMHNLNLVVQFYILPGNWLKSNMNNEQSVVKTIMIVRRESKLQQYIQYNQLKNVHHNNSITKRFQTAGDFNAVSARFKVKVSFKNRKPRIGTYLSFFYSCIRTRVENT